MHTTHLCGMVALRTNSVRPRKRQAMELQSSVLESYETAFRTVTSALERAGSAVNEQFRARSAADAELDDESLEAALDAYASTSNDLAGVLLRGVRTDRGTGRPDEALSRLAANLAGDLKVAG